MTISFEFNAMTGLKRDEGHWLAYRYDGDAGFRPESGESWLGFLRGSTLHSSLVQRGWITSVHQTDTKVWASDSAGRIYMNPKLGLSAPWQTFHLQGVLRGVWGLADDCVFTWGLFEGEPTAYHWGGSDWRQVESPGHIVGVHGIAPDLIIAVGQKGLVARWDGARGFRSMAGAAKGTLSDVHVASTDEIYACGPDGELVQGSVHGWEVLLTHPVALHCVTGCKGKIWVGGRDGLYVLVDEALELEKDNLAPIRLDGRDELLVTTRTHLVHSADGAKFMGFGIKGFSEMASRKPPSWR